MLGLQLIKPLYLAWASEVGFGFFRQGEKIVHVGATCGLVLVAGRQLFQAELTYRFKHSEPRLPALLLLLPQQALANERVQAVKGILDFRFLILD